MAYCNACGTEVPEAARFCQNCGANLASDDRSPSTTTIAMGAAPIGPSPYAPAYRPIPPHDQSPAYPLMPGSAMPPTKSGKAVAGFWIGLASIPCCILSWIGVIVGILGLIFGLVGLGETRRLALTSGESPRRYGQTQAIIGIVCAIVGIAASVVVLVYLLNNLEKYGVKISR